MKKESETLNQSPSTPNLFEKQVLQTETLKILENIPSQEKSGQEKEQVDKQDDTKKDFQYQVLKNVIHDCLESFSLDLKQDIQNMHIELLRQFQTQKVIIYFIT